MGGEPRLAVAGFCALAVLLALQPVIGAAGMALFLPGGFCYGLARVSVRTMLLSAVPAERAGRVFGVVNAVGLGLSVVVSYAVAVVMDEAGGRYGFFLTAALVAVAVAVLGPRVTGRKVRRGHADVGAGRKALGPPVPGPPDKNITGEV